MWWNYWFSMLMCKQIMWESSMYCQFCVINTRWWEVQRPSSTIYLNARYVATSWLYLELKLWALSLMCKFNQGGEPFMLVGWTFSEIFLWEMALTMLNIMVASLHASLVKQLILNFWVPFYRCIFGAFFCFLCAIGVPVKQVFSDNGTNFHSAVLKLPWCSL